MHKRRPPVPLAKWYCLSDDTHAQLFITPYIARLRVVAAPEYVSIATRIVTYVTSGDSTWYTPQEEPTCYALRLTRSGGPLELREGALLSFDNKAFARLTSLGRPYWRQLRPDEYDDSLHLMSADFLLSYIQLEFVDVTEFSEQELQYAHVLSAVNVRFN